jgi:hypothetical protein
MKVDLTRRQIELLLESSNKAADKSTDYWGGAQQWNVLRRAKEKLNVAIGRKTGRVGGP